MQHTDYSKLVEVERTISLLHMSWYQAESAFRERGRCISLRRLRSLTVITRMKDRQVPSNLNVETHSIAPDEAKRDGKLIEVREPRTISLVLLLFSIK